MRPRRFGVAVLSAAMLFVLHSASAGELEPFRMMRSLQIVQDRIANGDHAAMPMQRKLLETIDARLRTAEPKDFHDARNINALLIYGASGGNPATLESVFSTLDLEGPEKSLAQGLLSYVRGDITAAREKLSNVDPLKLDHEIAAPVALVAGSLLSRTHPEKALRLLDQARLLSPGTLVEEAALRRTIAVSARTGNPERFGLAAIQYVRRFLHSPYANQFAQDFVSAVVFMRDEVDFGVIEDITSMMSNEQAYTIYLRIARQSAVDGYDDLLAFASEKAKTYASETPEAEYDQRAALYAHLASITSANVENVRQALQAIDADRLSAEDRKLLQAARRVTERIVAPPVSRPGKAEHTNEDHLAAKPTPDGEDDSHFSATYMAEARSKLEAVDALLKEEGR